MKKVLFSLIAAAALFVATPASAERITYSATFGNTSYSNHGYTPHGYSPGILFVDSKTNKHRARPAPNNQRVIYVPVKLKYVWNGYAYELEDYRDNSRRYYTPSKRYDENGYGHGRDDHRYNGYDRR
jgi:hypothetical protein